MNLSTGQHDFTSKTAINLVIGSGSSYTGGDIDKTYLDDTLVDTNSTQSLTNKTIGVGQLTGNTRAYTGDGSTVAFTVTDGVTVQNTLVFLNGVFQRPTTDYTVSGTTLTFGTAPVNNDVITIKELVEGTNTFMSSSVVRAFTGDGSTQQFTMTSTPTMVATTITHQPH